MITDSIPEAFVWTKIQADAGQTVQSILRRKELERQSTSVEAVGQFLDGLHVASRSLFDVRACDFAQFFHVLAGRGEFHA
jgi:hypothetical protein